MTNDSTTTDPSEQDLIEPFSESYDAIVDIGFKALHEFLRRGEPGPGSLVLQEARVVIDLILPHLESQCAERLAQRDAEIAELKASRERLRKAFIKVDGMYSGEIDKHDEAIQELREADLTDAAPREEAER